MLRSKLLALTLFVLGGLAIPAHAEKPLKEQVVGTWIYVSSTGKNADGSEVQRPPLQGAVTYTADGHFHFIATSPTLPKAASNDPRKLTPEEAMAIATGVVAYTGTYTVDEATKTLNVTVKTASFPALMDAPQRRVINSISDTEMVFSNPRTPMGQTLEIKWKKDSQANDPATVKKELDQLIVKYVETHNKNDATGMMTMFAPDHIAVTSAGVFKTSAASFENRWKGGLTHLESKLDQVTLLAPNIALGIGTFRLSGKKDGKDISSEGTFTSTYVKHLDVWKVQSTSATPKPEK